MDTTKAKTKILAGLVIAAIGIFIWAQSNDDEPQRAGCTLTAAGVSVIATGLTRGEAARTIIATAGPTLGGLACRNLVESVVEEPNTPVAAEFQLGTGPTQLRSQTGTVTARTFLPQSSPSTEQSCLDWINLSLRVKCVLGEIGPPPF